MTSDKMESTNILPTISSSQQSDEVTIKQVLHLLIRAYKYLISKWLIIISFTAVGVLLGVIYAHSKKMLYVAEKTFVLEDSGGAGSQYAGIAAMMGVDLGGGVGSIFQGDNLFALYQSRKMVQSALLSTMMYKGKKESFINRYIDLNHLRKNWIKSELKNLTFPTKVEELTRIQDSVLTGVIADINKNYLSVDKADKKTSIISVKVKSTDELFSRDFNNQIVNTVNDFYVQTRTKKSMQNLNILQHQTDSVKNVLNGAIYQTVAIADATPNLNPTKQILRASGQRSQVTVEATKAILTQLVQNLEMAKITLRKETPLIQVVDEPTLPLPISMLTPTKGALIFGFLFFFLSIAIILIRKILSNLIK